MNTYTHKELVELMRKQITTSPKKAIAALLRIYENQRVDEKSYHSVYYKNGIGFKPQDVKVLSSMAEQAIHNKKMGKENLLTEKQVNWLLKLIAKYAGQLVEGSIAEGKILKLKKGEYINLSNFLNKIKDTLSQYGYDYSTSFKRTCNDDFYCFSCLNFGDKCSSVYVSGNVRTDYLAIEYDNVVYSFLPSGKHSFSVNTISYKAEDIDKFNFKNLSQWAEAQFNLLQLYKKCEKEKLMNKKLSNMKKDF